MKFSNLINLNNISIDKCNKQVGMNNRRSSPLSRSPIFSPALLSSCQIYSALTESTIHSPDLLSYHQIFFPLTRSPLLSPDLFSQQISLFSPDLLSSHQIILLA